MIADGLIPTYRMTRLPGLVGAHFALAFIGTIVAVPVAWAVAIGIRVAFPENLAVVSLTFPWRQSRVTQHRIDLRLFSQANRQRMP